jgi:uncharacterized protein (TIGR03118 family)
MFTRNLAIAGALALAPFAPSALAQHYQSAPEPPQQYTQTNLVSNLTGVAAVTDPNLANVWGLSRSSTGDWWVSDNTTGLSTLYSGTTGAITPLVVTIPPSDPNTTSTGSPTGTVFNGTADFAIAKGKPALFLFSTEDGTISGWNPGVNPGKAIITVNEGTASVFKGLTIAQASINGPLGYYLYAANFRKGQVSVYNTFFQHNTVAEQNFARFHAPAGYAPFNVQNIGDDIYVAYAKQDSVKHDEIDGAGLGLVAVFHADGCLIQVLQSGPWFNAPWGLAVAPSDFGAYSHDVLVGNFGSGEILAFDPVSGSYRGVLRDANSNPIKIPGLWGLSFGNGTVPGGPATTLYFGAGPDNEANGLFGTLTAVQNALGNGQ